MNEKRKKKIIFVVSGVVLLFVAIVLFLGFGMKDYVDKVPKITPKNEVSAAAGQTLSIEDIFDVECKGEYELNLSLADTDVFDAKVSDDKQTLYVGSSAGTITVSVTGYGEVAEPVGEENTVTVMK